LNLPSTFQLRGNSKGRFLDVNALFWNKLFSRESLKKICRSFEEKHKFSSFDRKYFSYLCSSISEIKDMMLDCYIYKNLERNLLFCFKVFLSVLSLLNSVNSGLEVLLSYGIKYYKDIKNVGFNSFHDNGFIDEFFDELLKNPFFENCVRYNVSIHWESELFSLIVLSNKIRQKFDDVKIIVDLSEANEQADFTQWLASKFIRKHIDNFDNVYHNDLPVTEPSDKDRSSLSYTPRLSVNTIFNTTKISTRLFNTRCYWNKCSFCTINSRHKSDFAFDSLTKDAKETVDKLILELSKYNELLYLTFVDEAIEDSILLYFAEQVINHKMAIKWTARTRFSGNFTYENCKILSQSGLKMIGLGLESVNPRILNLMNKRERNYNIEELNQIIGNFDQNNISVHSYFIIGFPSETKAETKQTLDFIDYNLKTRKYFTFSANHFFLMKGSKIYHEPEKYGIKIIDRNEDVKIGNIDYIDRNKGSKYTRDEIVYLAKKAYSKMFFKKIDGDYTIMIGYDFWDFIDRTILFYNHKFYNDKNPYWEDKSKNNLAADDLDSYYKIISLPFHERDKFRIFDTINERFVRFSRKHEVLLDHFIRFYNPELTLRQNIDRALQIRQTRVLKDKSEFLKMINQLISCSYLYRVGKQQV
jgi:hypothetical protein